MAVNWDKILGAPVGTAAPGSSGASSTLTTLMQMSPSAAQDYVNQLQGLTQQQKQALLAQLAQMRTQGQQPQQASMQPTTPTPQAQQAAQPGTGFQCAPGAPGLGTQPQANTPISQLVQQQPAGSQSKTDNQSSLYTSQPPAAVNDPMTIGGAAISGMTQDEMWKYASQALGFDAKAAYQSYATGWSAATQNHGWRTDTQSGQADANLTQAQAPNAWLQSTITAFEGQFAPVIDLYANVFGQETGQTMSAATRQSLSQALQNATPDIRASIQAEMITMQQGSPKPTTLQQNALNAAITKNDPVAYQAALSQYQDSSAYTKWASDNKAAMTALEGYVGTGGFLYNMFSDAVRTTPSVQSDAAHAAITAAFTAVGMIPTAADYASLAKATPDEIQQALFNKPLPSDPKVPYGTYTAVKAYVDPLYAQYFGAPPTQDQLMSYMGMNQGQILDHIMASPSKQLPGATVGRYSQLKGFADSAVSSIGYGVSDQVIAAAHKGMQTP